MDKNTVEKSDIFDMLCRRADSGEDFYFEIGIEDENLSDRELYARDLRARLFSRYPGAELMVELSAKGTLTVKYRH